MRSAFPDVLIDAQYWAFIMQMCLGDKAFFQNRISHGVPFLDGRSGVSSFPLHWGD
jgi:hypothetical protein